MIGIKESFSLAQNLSSIVESESYAKSSGDHFNL